MHVEFTPTIAAKPLLQLAVSEVDSLASSQIAKMVHSRPALVVGGKNDFMRASACFGGLRPNEMVFGSYGGSSYSSTGGFTQGASQQPHQSYDDEVGIAEEPYSKESSFRQAGKVIRDTVIDVACALDLPGCPPDRRRGGHMQQVDGGFHGNNQFALRN